MIVSVDGGCAGVRDVKAGVIAATAQQYPLKMASLAVEAGVNYATTGKKVNGYVDTGVTLITDKKAAGVESQDTAFGLGACWGETRARTFATAAGFNRFERLDIRTAGLVFYALGA